MKKYIIAIFLLVCAIASAETIAEKLTRIDNEKTAIGSAIVAKGQTVTTFETYSEAIASITAGGTASESWQEAYSGVSWTTATESTPFDTSAFPLWVASWTEYNALSYAASTSVAVAHSMGGEAFWGSCLTASGDVVLIPRSGNNFCLYSKTTKTITTKAAHGLTEPAFEGGSLDTAGKIVCAPSSAGKVAVYDPVADTIASTTHAQGSSAFRGSTLLPSGKTLLCPFNSDNICIFDSTAMSISVGPAHGQGDGAFSGARLTGSNTVILTPYNSNNFGIYDISTGLYYNGATFGATTDAAFNGAGTMVPNGNIIFAPEALANIGIFTPDGIASGSYTSGPAHGEGAGAFGGSVLLPNQHVLLSPWSGDYIGDYDWVSNRYRRLMPAPLTTAGLFSGKPTLMEDGTLLFAPWTVGGINCYTLKTSFDGILLENLIHPLNNGY